jgi:'Cold-shock' DNA-binding domain
MASGTVKWFDPNRGYGFIRPEQGEDVCVCVAHGHGAAPLRGPARPANEAITRWRRGLTKPDLMGADYQGSPAAS